MFATTDEAFADLRKTLEGIPDGEWVPPLAVWLDHVDGVGLTTVQASLYKRNTELWRAWQAKRKAHFQTVKAAVVIGYSEGQNDGVIAAKLGIERSRVRYVRLQLPEKVGHRDFVDWAAKAKLIPRGCRQMEIRFFVADVGTPYQTAYSALRQGRVPGWGLLGGLAVRTEVARACGK